MTGAKTGRRLAQEDGFTLPELLIATVIALLVAAGGMMILQIAVRTQPQISERAAQIQQGRVMMEALSRELRQGESITTATPTELELITFVNSQTCGGPSAQNSIICRVSYSCEGGACTRSEHDGAGGGSSRQVVDGLLSQNVFCYQPHRDQSSCPEPGETPSYVAIELAFPGDDGAETVTLRDGVALRNHSPPPEGEEEEG
jgi:prepilin-type N-terminal cleavage/methylation domain-containing protein